MPALRSIRIGNESFSMVQQCVVASEGARRE